MSRATHDIECFRDRGGCGYQGKVADDQIVCPKCGRSVEGQAITGDALEAMFLRFSLRQKGRQEAGLVSQNFNKEAKS